MDERLVELLGLYGLGEREARIFVFLTKNPSCGAGEMAKALGIRRMEAYRLLKRLLDRGVVMATAGKPIKYQAESLEGILSLMTDEQRGHIKRMDDARPELTDLWKRLPRTERESFEQRFRIVQGREQIFASLAKMVEAATSSVRLVLTKNDAVQAHVLGIVDRLVAAKKKGVKVEVITPIDSSTLEAVDALAKAAEVRHSDEAARSRLVIVDGSQSLVSLVLDDSKGMKNERDVAIWTDSRDYAEMMGGLYQVSFGRAEEASARLAAMRERLRSEEKTSSLVGVLRAALSGRGWKVEAPGRIKGASGNDFDFSAVLSGPDGQKAGLDVVFGHRDSPVGERVTAAALKKLDIRDAAMVIVASPMPDDQTQGLARLLGVTVIDGSDAVDAAAEVRDSVSGAA